MRPLVRLFVYGAGAVLGLGATHVTLNALGSSTSAQAQQRTPAKAPPRYPEREMHRPSPMPDRIILTWTGDPTRTQAVTWRTDSSVLQGLAQIAPSEDGPAFTKRAREVLARSRSFTSDLGSARYHTVEFEGLNPASRYVYRVGDGTNWSEWIQFRTASTENEPFSFIYFGDAQNDVRSMWSRVIREAHSDAPRARFIVHAGDLINSGNRDAEWGEWFGAGGWINAMIPSIPTPGNHEYPRSGTGTTRKLSVHWRPQFALPLNGPEGLEETAYYIDYQGTRLVSLNSNEQQAEQVEWLDRVLSDNPNRWTVLTFHHPIWSTAKGRDNASLRKIWLPVIRKHRVDLVLQGHDHTYARSNLKTGLNKQERDVGTVFVVSVSGPKMYNLVREDWMRRAAEDTQMYQVISIKGDRLRYEAHTASGDLYDAFDLHKRDQGPNHLVNRIPGGVKERRRVSPPQPAADRKAGVR